MHHIPIVLLNPAPLLSPARVLICVAVSHTRLTRSRLCFLPIVHLEDGSCLFRDAVSREPPFPVFPRCLYVRGLEYCSSKTSPPSLWTSGPGIHGGKRRVCLGESFCSDSSFVFQSLGYLHLEESSCASNRLGLVSSALGLMPGNSMCLVQLDTIHTRRSGMFYNNPMLT